MYANDTEELPPHKALERLVKDILAGQPPDGIKEGPAFVEQGQHERHFDHGDQVVACTAQQQQRLEAVIQVRVYGEHRAARAGEREWLPDQVFHEWRGVSQDGGLLWSCVKGAKGTRGTTSSDPSVSISGSAAVVQ